MLAAAILVGGVMLVSNVRDDSSDERAIEVALLQTTPRFSLLRTPGELRLSGHAVSERHERKLRNAAIASYSGHKITVNFEPLGIVPRYWEDATEKMVITLARPAMVSAELAADTLRIRSVLGGDTDWQEQIDALVASLPGSIEVFRDTIVVASDTESESVCSAALDAFSPGRVKFKESSIVLRHSAYPRLARIAAIADACRGWAIAITGHTDASGDETWNRQLSINRANAVADYLVEKGVDHARLTVFGAGSSAPVASNNSDYSRGLNRRIEFVFSELTP